jgi:hypothetical protein
VTVSHSWARRKEVTGLDDHEKVEQVALALHMRSREADILDVMNTMLDEMLRLDETVRAKMKKSLQALNEWRKALGSAADTTYVGEFERADDALSEARQAAGSSQIDTLVRDFPEFREKIDELRVLTEDLWQGWTSFKQDHLT